MAMDFLNKIANPALEQHASHTKDAYNFIDTVASITGIFALITGILQLSGPLPVDIVIGMEEGNGAYALAAIWSFCGIVMLLGGIAKQRAAIIYASELLFIVTICTTAILLWQSAAIIAVIIQGGLGILCLTTGGLGRLSERAEISRQIKLSRATVLQNQEN